MAKANRLIENRPISLSFNELNIALPSKKTSMSSIQHHQNTVLGY
jgi:hypothetical protein